MGRSRTCRLPYKDEAGNEGYFLSPKDLCAIDLLGDLVNAGVSSIKIEGRMKSAEYVGTVVRIYRKYLDLALRGKSYQVDPKDQEDLLQVFNRGGFSQGYLAGQPGQSLLSGRIPKHQGVLVGKVLQRPKEKDLVDISFTKQLTLGDGIEIHGREINSNILTYYRDMGKKVARIGDFKGDIRKGDLVYRTSSKTLTGEIRNTFSRGTGQSSRTIPVSMEEARLNARSLELLELVGLENHKKRIGSYSRGMKQRLGIAQALLNEPKLLICDEPTSALDPVGRKEILDILETVKGKTTVLFSTHILSDVERICDRVAVLHDGGIQLCGTLQELKTQRKAETIVVEFKSAQDNAAFREKNPQLTMEAKERTLTIHTGDLMATQKIIMRSLLEAELYPEKIEVAEPTIESLFLGVVS